MTAAHEWDQQILAGVRLEVNYLHHFVALMAGHMCVARLSFDELERRVGLQAASELVRR